MAPKHALRPRRGRRILLYSLLFGALLAAALSSIPQSIIDQRNGEVAHQVVENAGVHR